MEIEKLGPSRPVTPSVKRFPDKSVQPVKEEEKSVQSESREQDKPITKEELQKTIDGLNKFLEP